MRHNKKRNTAFLYECLIKELTKAIIRKDNMTKQKVLVIVKENFAKNSILYEDLFLYKQLLETKKLDEKYAKRFLVEVKKDWESIDRKKVFNAQTNLIRKINEVLAPDVFSNFIDNYRNIATAGSFLQSSSLKAKQRIVTEDRMMILVSQPKDKGKEIKHVDNLTYNTFVSKFNETYKHTLRDEQRSLLTNYITSFSDNGLGLKSFMNEEIGRLKESMKTIISGPGVSETYKERGTKVLQKLEEFSKIPINEEMVKDIFYIQDLIGEIIKNANN
tara:strand:- start:149 stop:970 length:822 start_codon:yes stop_codon:yes gene_type:complete